jgi:hypothetical protein
MELDPACRLLLATVKFADADVPEPVRVAVPKTAPPRANKMLPVGSEFPVTGFTRTFRDVVPPGAIVPELAVTVMLVATAGAATVTATGDEAEDANAADPSAADPP